MESGMAAVQAATAGAVQLDDQNPWPGLAAYDEGAQDYFKGRDDEKGELLRLVSRYPHVALFGKSGLGKSSLLQAGLFPLLRQKKTFLPVYMRLNFQADAPLPPMMQALQALLAALRDNACDHPVPEPDETLWHYLHRRDLELWSDDNYPLTPVLVFDQFEEIFAPRAADAPALESLMVEFGDLVEPSRVPAALTRTPATPDDATRLRRQLQALDLQKRRYRTVIAFREDHVAAFKAWELRIPILLQNFLRLQPMSREQAIAAVSEPGAAVLASGVATKIVDFVGNLGAEGGDAVVADGTVEPVLLSLCCTQLNSRRTPGEKIDADLLRTAGDDILKRFYTDALAGLPASVPRFIESLLVQGRRYRSSYPVQLAIDERHISGGDLALLTDKRRLLRVDPHSGVDKVELIHDRLVGVVVDARDQRLAEEAKATAAAAAEREKTEAAAAAAAAEKAAAAARAAEAAELQRNREMAQAALEAERQGIANQRLRNSRSLLAAVCALLALAVVLALWQSSVAEAQTQLARKNELRAVAEAASAAAASAREADLQRRVTQDQILAATQQAELAASRALKEAELRQGAEKQRARAEAAEMRARDSRRVAIALRLATEGTATLAGVRNGTDRQALLELVAARRIAPELPAVNAQLLDAIVKNGRLIRLIEAGGPLAAYNPDASLVLTESGNGSLRIIDAATGRPNGPDLRPPTDAGEDSGLMSLAWSADGRRIAASRDDGKVLLWDAASRRLLRTLGGNEDSMRTLVFSRDGQHLVVGDEVGRLRWFRAADGVADGDALDVNEDTVQALAYSSDGRLLASAGDSGEIRIIEMPARKLREPAMQAPQGGEGVLTLAFKPDGSLLASGGRDKLLRLWDVATGKPAGQPLTGHDDAITALAFRPDGKVLASASDDKTVRYWGDPPADGEKEASVRLVSQGEPQRGHDRGVKAVAFSADGDRLLTAGADDTVRVWRSPLGAYYGYPLAGLVRRPLYRIGFTAPGKLRAIHDDGALTRWNTETGQREAMTRRPELSPAMARTPGSAPTARERASTLANLSTAIAYSADGRRWVERRYDGRLIVWDVASRQQVGPVLMGPARNVAAVTYSPDARHVAVATRDAKLWLWDTASGTDAPSKLDLPASALAAAFAPHESRLAVGLIDGRVQFLDGATGALLSELSIGDGRPAGLLAYNADGQRLVVGGRDGSVQLWSLGGGRPARLWHSAGHVDAVTAAAFSDDGRRIATGGDDASLRLWSAADGRAIGIPMRGHLRTVTSVSFSPDGQRIATGGRDGTARVWPIYETWPDIVCSKLGRDLDVAEWAELVAPDMEYVRPCENLLADRPTTPRGGTLRRAVKTR